LLCINGSKREQTWLNFTR